MCNGDLLTDVQHGGGHDEVPHGRVGLGLELLELLLGVRGRRDYDRKSPVLAPRVGDLGYPGSGRLGGKGGKGGDTRGLNALVSSIEASSKPPSTSIGLLITESIPSPELYIFSTFMYLALPT